MSGQDSAGPSRPLTRNPILWGAYLGCSWTWCIGMFFPVLLLRDFGWAGYTAFAIPNVVGAAAMGWILRSKEQSVRFVERHPSALWWFSAITIAFHVFWVIWLTSFIRSALLLPDVYLFGAGAITIAFAFSSGRLIRAGMGPQLSLLLWLFSLGLLIALQITPHAQPAMDTLMASPRAASGVGWFVPVSIFGFLLCPYLDITFHHARQNLHSPRAARIGFTLGFGIFFALMIVLTTRYAGVIAGALSGESFRPIVAPWLSAWILIHLLCQWIFTVRVHLDRMTTLASNPLLGHRMLFVLALIAGGAGYAAPRISAHAGLSAGEITYRCFLTFYGLVFPAYMLYRVIRSHSTDVPLQRWMMWLAIGVAAPMFWMGFIERQSIWLGPGMLVIICGAYALKGKDRSVVQV